MRTSHYLLIILALPVFTLAHAQCESDAVSVKTINVASQRANDLVKQVEAERLAAEKALRDKSVELGWAEQRLHSFMADLPKDAVYSKLEARKREAAIKLVEKSEQMRQIKDKSGSVSLLCKQYASMAENMDQLIDASRQQAAMLSVIAAELK